MQKVVSSHIIFSLFFCLILASLKRKPLVFLLLLLLFHFFKYSFSILILGLLVYSKSNFNVLINADFYFWVGH